MWFVVCNVPDKAGRGCPSLLTVWSIRPFSFFPNNRPMDDLIPFFCLLQQRVAKLVLIWHLHYHQQ